MHQPLSSLAKLAPASHKDIRENLPDYPALLFFALLPKDGMVSHPVKA